MRIEIEKSFTKSQILLKVGRRHYLFEDEENQCCVDLDGLRAI